MHFFDYNGHYDVSGSTFAFDLGGRQIRYLAVRPRRSATIRKSGLLKGDDRTAPAVLTVTVEVCE